MPSWYEESLVLLQLERDYVPGEYPPALSGADRAELTRALESVAPDTVSYPAKGRSGLVPYPTQFGNQLSSVGGGADVLSLYREITTELGQRFLLSYSGLIDYHAADTHPEWQRVRLDHTPYASRALCPNSGYVEELLLPQLEELLERYSPDGIVTEEDAWTVSPCYCEGCRGEFRLMHGGDPPHARSETRWEEWLQLHRDSFARYLDRVARFLHDRQSNEGALVVASVGAFTALQPEPAVPAPDRSNARLPAAFALATAGLEARLLDARELPFDLTTPTRCSPRPYPQGTQPALPAYPKSYDHLAQEGAVILASGGRWTLSLPAQGDDSLPDRELDTLADAVSFARARREWSTDTDSGAYVAVLHSGATHRRAGNGLYDGGPCLDRVRGAHQMLQELHHPHDIVTEDALLRRLPQYKVVILPEQVALSHSMDEPLLEWVQNGGRLIASGRVAPRIIEDLPTFSLEEALGVRWTGRQDREGWFMHRGVPLQIAAPVYHVSPYGAQTYLPMLRSGHEQRPEYADSPAVTRQSYGSGEGWYLASDFFAAYYRCQYPGFRELLGELFERTLPDPALATDAPPSVEIVWRRRGTTQILHLIDHDPGKSQAPNSAYVEAVPRTAPFSLTLSLDFQPDHVRIVPEGSEADWRCDERQVIVQVPEFQIHTALVVEM